MLNGFMCYDTDTTEEPVIAEITPHKTPAIVLGLSDVHPRGGDTSNSSEHTGANNTRSPAHRQSHSPPGALNDSNHTPPSVAVCAVQPRRQPTPAAPAHTMDQSTTPANQVGRTIPGDITAHQHPPPQPPSLTPDGPATTERATPIAHEDMPTFDITTAFLTDMPTSPEVGPAHNDSASSLHAAEPGHTSTPNRDADWPQPPTERADNKPEPPPPLTPIAYRPILDRIWPHPRPDQWINHTLYHNIYVKVRQTALPNHMSAKISIPSGLNIAAWRSMLVGYHDKRLVDYLEYGWPVDYTAVAPPTTSDSNHTEDLAHLASVSTYVRTELPHGALLGPFSQPPFTPWSQTSPMMTRPKKNSVNRRVIVDLSWPKPGSVNAGIRKGVYQGRPAAYTLPNIMDPADEVSRLGKGAFIWCADLARAYRQLRTCPLSIPLLGITLDGAYYTDIAPPFGCRTSSMACARTTNAVVYLMRKQGHFLHCYLDDFVGVAPTKVDADSAYSDLLVITQKLGLALSPAKCHPPAKTVEWLGFVISVDDMQVTIPRAKLDDTLIECQQWMSRTSASRKELQRLVGRLQHIAKCVQPARRFMSRIFAAVRNAPQRGRSVVPAELRSDIRWFLEFAQRFNGKVLLKTAEKTPWTIECDSSMKAGGAFSPDLYYGKAYPPEFAQTYTNIAHLEAINLVIAMRTLAPDNPHEYHIIINTDNSASQQVLDSGAGRDPILTACAREIWLYAASNSCEVTVMHKPGKDLVLADALSRRSFDPAAEVRAATLINQLNIAETYVNFNEPFTSNL